MKMNKKGFTLVEIMIVVAIIGVLAAIAIPNFVRYRKSAQMNACIGNLKQLQSACEQYRMKEGDSQKPTVTDLCGSGKYIKVTPKCPADSTKGYTFVADGDDWVPQCENATTAGTEYPHKLPAE